jgi:phage terminase large subunit
MITIGKPKEWKPFVVFKNHIDTFPIWLQPKQENQGWSILKSEKKYIKFWGGARSGKTFLIVLFLIMRANKYRGSKHIVCRYSHTTCKKTVWRQTMLPILRILKKLGFCEINYSQAYAYFPRTDSYIFTGGLRPTDIGSILSSEYESVFCCEANENSWSIMEDLKTRLQGTSADSTGKLIPLKFMIDLNPTVKQHWSNVAWLLGINPESQLPIANFDLYDHLHFKPEDNIDNLAEGYIEDLQDLSGAKRLRYYTGEYGAYEGLVYNLDENDIIDDDYDLIKDARKIIAIDFGYVNPFCALFLAEIQETIYIYREYYAVQRTVPNHAKEIKKFHKYDLTNRGEHINTTYRSIVCDHDAGDRAILYENGIRTKPAFKTISPGIDRVTDFLERHRIKVFRSCANTIDEFNSYQWLERATGVTKDREPKKENDHAMDALRYGVCELFPVQPQSSAVLSIGYY